MKPYFETELGRLYHGHVLDVLEELPDESVQCCVTSPPYWGLRDYNLPPQIWDGFRKDCEFDKYHIHTWGDEQPGDPRGGSGPNAKEFYAGDGKTTYARQVPRGQFCQTCNAWRGSLGLEPTPELYIKHMVQIFREVKRVLRKDGTLWINIGDSYGHSQPGRNRNGTGGQIIRPYGQSDRVQKGNSQMNHGCKPKDLIGIPWMLAFALRDRGWYLRSDIIWHKPNPMPESVTDRPTKAHEYIFLLSKAQKYFYDGEAIKEDAQDWGFRDRTGQKAFTSGVMPDGQPHKGCININFKERGRNKRTVWTISTQPFPEAHFATFPEKLIKPCIFAGTSEKSSCSACGSPWERVVEKKYGNDNSSTNHIAGGDKTIGQGWEGIQRRADVETKTIGWKPSCKCDAGPPIACTVLDPFGGAATTGLVCEKYGRKYILIELSETYINEIAIPRLDQEARQMKIF